MTLQTLDGLKFKAMVLSGAHNLTNNADRIDALNVFPVPDGDTGTNMNLSMTAGVKEVEEVNSDHMSEVCGALAKGLLMGARGNSGVILSQIFRGFAAGVENKKEVTVSDLAHAFDKGVKTAYKAVMKPVEGTILTVAKDAAAQAVQVAKTEKDIIIFMEEVLQEARASLQRTPDLLPILKEVGVVDSGGQGLVSIYEGFLSALKGEELPTQDASTIDIDEMVHATHHKIAQDFMDTSDIEHGYCTEFMVKFDQDKLKENPFDEESFRNELSEYGDSLLVVSDDEVVKVHVHAEYPGDVLTIAQRFGGLINMDIENMREQHSAIVSGQHKEVQNQEKADYAIITVAMGTGIKSLFESLGASVVIEGGQTMNPSTQDITNAIQEAHAKNILILPNNKNIVMAAEQAAEIAEDNVEVILTETIPQGISAMLAFQEDVIIAENKTAMSEATQGVKTGQVTYAVRDTKIDGITIEKGNFMGIADSKIKASHQDKQETVELLLQDLITEEDEILTVIHGEGVSEAEVNILVQYIEKTYEDIELEVYNGKQPIYSYIFSVE